MPLPPRNYFFLPEVAERWGITTIELATYAHDGLLELCAMAVSRMAATGVIEGSPEDWSPVQTDRQLLNGPQPLLTADLWPIIENRVGTIARFKSRVPSGYVALVEGEEPVRVALNQLLVLREEQERIEALYQIKVVERTPQAAGFSDFAHAPDYGRVTLAGRSFILGPTQASIVRELHAASLRGEPWLHHQELLQRAGSRSVRLVDVFKSQKDWRTLIAVDGRGRCKLNVAARPPSKSRRQAFRRAITMQKPPIRNEVVDNGER